MPSDHVLQNLDVEYLYEAPLAMEEEHLASVVCECLKLDCPEPDLKDWKEMVECLKHPTQDVTVALVGKYIQLHDAYISVVEALKHGGIYSHTTVNIKWIDSETVTPENVDELLGDVSGILVPGGFGDRGIEGKIEAIKYARTHKVPFLGLCLGMQLAIVEFARDVVGYHDAHSVELNPNITHPVIHIMPTRSVLKTSVEPFVLVLILVFLTKNQKLINYMEKKKSTNVIVIVMKSTMTTVMLLLRTVCSYPDFLRTAES